MLFFFFFFLKSFMLCTAFCMFVLGLSLENIGCTIILLMNYLMLGC